jgi:hypothetical protein
MRDDEGSTLIQKVIYEIGVYLQQNPEAKDTVEGIRRWWIPRGEERFSEEEVRSALDLMVIRSWAQESRVADTVLYSTTRAGLMELIARAKKQPALEDS